jgi:hypothetical protein
MAEIPNNRPRGREQNITGKGKDIFIHGEGLGTGPVGGAGGHAGRPTGNPASDAAKSVVGHAAANTAKTAAKVVSNAANGGGGNGGFTRAAKRGSPILLIVIILAVVLFGKNLFGGGSNSAVTTPPAITQAPAAAATLPPASSGSGYSSSASAGSSYSGGQSLDLSSLLGGLNASSSSSGWTQKANTGTLNTTVAPGARAKRTEILGGGRDTVTLMVFMCGTDLESRSGMGTADLQEMAAASIGANVNLLVYTGGCRQWRNNVVSSSTNQIYKVESGGLRCLEKDLGAKAMTKPETLSTFIKWCTKNYPANRNMLIFWDHGGGSLSGYGYDEKFKSSGSMTLKDINEALKSAGTAFDFIGFDACLMATTENALMLSSYGDYMIASEETEPGVGWYYTNWLTKLSANTSMPTLEIGKNIVDDFVTVCGQKCSGQKTTLSVVDLAELSATVPQELSDFSAATSALMEGNEYKTVSNARSGAREFSSSSRIDQVDLVSFAYKMGTQEGADLAAALLGAVKYNRTSSNMTDAYGLSIYLPYQKVSQVDSAVATYTAIGMDDDYMRCIQQFASMETGGQLISGGASSPLFSLLGGSYGGSSSYGSNGYGSAGATSTDMISSLLGGLLGGDLGGVSGLTGSNSGFLGRGLEDVENTAAYLAANRFDAGALQWQPGADGTGVLYLSEEQWSLIQALELNVFYDNGKGYIDLGLDTLYNFTDDGGLLAEFSGAWLAIDSQPVAYYHEDTYDDGTNYMITGRVPVLLNEERADLILVFDNDHPHGYIAGARFDYRDGETATVAKALSALEPGDVIQPLADFYGYDGSYQDSYRMGTPITVTEDTAISDVYIDAAAANATYRFTDMYQQTYWTPVFQ